MPVPVVFQSLSDPTRLRLVEELRRGERSVGALVTAVSVCQPGVSRHLRILHTAGIVRVRAEGQRRLYSLRKKPFQELDDWMEDYRVMVESRLDRLQDLIERDEPVVASGTTKHKTEKK